MELRRLIPLATMLLFLMPWQSQAQSNRTEPTTTSTYEVRGKEIYDIRETSDRFIDVYVDTIFTVKCGLIDQLQPAAEPVVNDTTARGHYIQAMAGLGYGSLGYSLKDNGKRAGANQGDLQGVLQVQYGYNFTENWGILVGLGLSGYGSYGVLNHTFTWPGQTDSDGKPYDHLADARKWREHQIMHMVEVPLGVQYQRPINDRLKWYAGAGFRFGVPVYSKWKLCKGEVENQGYYKWLGNADPVKGTHDFNTVKADEYGTDRRNLDTKKFAMAIDLNGGVLFPLAKNLDLMAGLYAQINCISLHEGTDAPVGWRQADAAPQVQHNFMNDYAGELNTNLVKHTLPWGVGVKVGIRWHKAPKPEKPEPVYKKVEVCDTTFAIVERGDTTMKMKREPVEKIIRLMKRSVIWFDVNSTVPKLKPADIIEKIAEILKENPEQHIIVSGHASKEGNAEKNRILAEKRAQAVADLLIKEGVNPEQLQIESHAADIEYKTEEGQTHTIALDRRTEIIPVE